MVLSYMPPVVRPKLKGLRKMRARAAEPSGRERPNDKLKCAFVEALVKTRDVSESARAIGRSRRLVYVWRASDPLFKEAWDEAWATVADNLEGSFLTRAIEGVVEPVYHMGRVVGSVRKFNEASAMFALQKMRPERWGDQALEKRIKELEELLVRLHNARNERSGRKEPNDEVAEST